jgi:hypothetical protein
MESLHGHHPVKKTKKRYVRFFVAGGYGTGVGSLQVFVGILLRVWPLLMIGIPVLLLGITLLVTGSKRKKLHIKEMLSQPTFEANIVKNLKTVQCPACEALLLDGRCTRCPLKLCRKCGAYDPSGASVHCASCGNKL